MSETPDDEVANKWAFSDTLPHAMFVEIVDHLNNVHGVSWASMGRHVGSKSTNKGAGSVVKAAKYQFSGHRNRYNPTLWAPRARSMLDRWCDCVRE
jgi:hypothetical protein